MAGWKDFAGAVVVGGDCGNEFLQVASGLDGVGDSGGVGWEDVG